MCPNNGYIMADGLRKTFVNLHNNHRLDLVNQRVANGNSGQKLRSGSKMMLIKYDCEAEKTAFEWAKQCIDADSSTASRRNWAENRYTFPNKNLDPNTVATRMAWDTHEYIGCAMYHCPSFINAVCHYGPAGQFGPGKQIYKPGPKCNRCGTVGATCLGGLCRR
ncbi:SCP-like protein [Ancylostoma ceylanicum]|uniref:SCP-like protein n=1 Tax=Ancylostoma ceylanicum TaxID=53326 RepID=A0A0D6LCK3_9BILA|nr:SCP-like protein [Ancylostoma ceylanicum]